MNLTSWSIEPPVQAGWYTSSAETVAKRTENFLRYWNGARWSAPIHREDIDDPVRLERTRISRGESQYGVVWQALNSAHTQQCEPLTA